MLYLYMLRCSKNCMKFLENAMFWYNVFNNNSSYYLKMLYVTEIAKFLCQFHYNELSSDHFLSLSSLTDSCCFTLILYKDVLTEVLHLQGDSKKGLLTSTGFW